jgi:hypothetical protein
MRLLPAQVNAVWLTFRARALKLVRPREDVPPDRRLRVSHVNVTWFDRLTYEAGQTVAGVREHRLPEGEL